MNTSISTDCGASSPADEPPVLWWRDTAGDVDVPRGHGVGWAARDGSKHGRLTLASEHVRLDVDQIAALLTDEVGTGDFQQLARATGSVSPAVLLYSAGHVVVELDLADHFGPDCVVGVAVELRGHGIAARVAVRPGLAQPERDAALAWAVARVDGFLTASRESSLDAHGWTQTTASRWQIIARTPEPAPTERPYRNRYDG